MKYAKIPQFYTEDNLFVENNNPIDILGNVVTKSQLIRILNSDEDIRTTEIKTHISVAFDAYDLIDSLVETHWQYADDMPEIRDWVETYCANTALDYYDIMRIEIENYLECYADTILEEYDLQYMMEFILDDLYYNYESAIRLGEYPEEVAETYMQIELLPTNEIEVLQKYENCIDMEELGERIIRDDWQIQQIGEYYFLTM